MKEKSCVYGFINRADKAFANNSSLKSVFLSIPRYRHLLHAVYGDQRTLLHDIATSTFGLEALAAYEFARYKGLPLPDANSLIQRILPLKRRLSMALLHRVGKEYYLKSNESQLQHSDVTA